MNCDCNKDHDFDGVMITDDGDFLFAKTLEKYLSGEFLLEFVPRKPGLPIGSIEFYRINEEKKRDIIFHLRQRTKLEFEAIARDLGCAVVNQDNIFKRIYA